MRRSDPHLAAMSGVFGRLSAGQRHARPGAGRPGACQPQPPPAAAWSVAALITLAAAISVLLSKTVAGATASATPARATAKPSHRDNPWSTWTRPTGTTVAVEDVSFSVRRGEIFGVPGRNGAGKTTTVEGISGLRT